jgi:tRNA/rRNA methyltransferase
MNTRGPSAADPRAPAFVMVQPQLGENIGSFARAMMNFGLCDLRIVNPRDGWPNPKAYAVASGADAVLDQAQLCWTLTDAIADHTLIFASTARARAMEKPAVTPAEMAAEARAEIARGGSVAVLFGKERTGLDNVDIAMADKIVSIPVNPAFPSLNVAQAGVLIAYELRSAAVELTAAQPLSPAAPQGAFEGLMAHLEQELEDGGFFFPPEKAAIVKANMRNALLRARFTEQEIASLRGAIKALSIGRGAKWRKRLGEPSNRP